MRPLSKDFIVNNTTANTKYYTTYQYKEFTDDDECYRISKDCDKVFAKSVQERLGKDAMSPDTPQTKYYVRGNNGKQLFDPFPKYSISDNKSSFVDKVCKGDQRFIEVTRSVFNKYITFLKTESNQYLTSAQREIM